MKKFLSSFMHYYAYSTTATILVVAVYMALRKSEIDQDVLWQIMINCGITSLTSTIILEMDFNNIKEMALGLSIHYFLVFSISVALIDWFDWFELTFSNVMRTLLACLVIYAFTTFMHFYADREHIDDMNEELKKRFGE